MPLLSRLFDSTNEIWADRHAQISPDPGTQALFMEDNNADRR